MNIPIDINQDGENEAEIDLNHEEISIKLNFKGILKAIFSCFGCK